MALDGADGRTLRHARDQTTGAPAEGPGDVSLSEISAQYLAVLKKIADSVKEPDSRPDAGKTTRGDQEAFAATVTASDDQPAHAQEDPAAPRAAFAAAAEASAGLVQADAVDGDWIDTLHMDGISSGPGEGGWSVHLDSGEIVERNDHSLLLSRDAAGVIILDGSGEIAFEGIDRIEWQPFQFA